jgi:outer membrane protein assembly factor BamB
MAWNPAAGLVFIPAQNTSFFYEQVGEFAHRPGQWNTGVQLIGGRGRPPRPALSGPATMLVARDPTTNREVWRVPTSGGHGGTLSTGGGLVFHGTGNQLVAYDARTGDELWAAEVGNGTATPVTYELDGRQYVSIAAGGSGGAPPRMWTFALEGG